MNIVRPITALAILFALPGCISFGGKAPPVLLTMTPAVSLSADSARALNPDTAIAISTPVVTQAISGTRVAVADGPTMIAYVKDAVWVEPPAQLFQRLLSETVAVQSGKVVVDSRQNLVAASAQLSGQLIAFNLDARRQQAVVTYDAVLIRAKGKPAALRRFEARVAVSKIEADEAGRALNRAANMVAADVAAWIGKD